MIPRKVGCEFASECRAFTPSGWIRRYDDDNYTMAPPVTVVGVAE